MQPAVAERGDLATGVANAAIRLLEKKLPVSRRDFFRTLGRTAGIGAVGLLAGSTYAYAVEPRWLEISRHQVFLPKLPGAFQGMKIVQLSDLHHSEVLGREYLEAVFRAAMFEKPDLLVITGDFLTGFRGLLGNINSRKTDYYVGELTCLLRTLKAPLGVFGCMGNHDFWYGLSTMKKCLADGGVRLLRDQNVRLRRRGESVVLAGFTDLWSEKICWHWALRRTSRKDCRIGIMHNPDGFFQTVRFGVDFVMCGHTHGGQISLPIIGPPVLPIANRRFVQGWFREGGTQMYVNRGVGVIGLPVRINARPELTVFELHPETV